MNEQIKTNDRIIKTIRENSFISFLEWASDSTNLEIVFTALISTPRAPLGEVIYVKLYPLSSGLNSRGLINEVTGWLINHSLKVPQATNAYILRIPINALKTAKADDKAKKVINSLKEKKISHYWCFGSTDLKGQPAGISFDRTASNLETIKKDVAEWDNLHKAISADEHMANTDRHINNLIRTRNKSYAVIDNGILCTDTQKNWSLADVTDPHRIFKNRLSEIIFGHHTSLENGSKVIYHSYLHEESIHTIIDELEYWCSKLINNDIEKYAYLKFMIERAKNVTELIMKRYNIIG